MKKLFLRFSAFRSLVHKHIFFCVGFIFTFTASMAFAQSPVPDSAQVERLAGGFSLAEGPLWHPDGFLLCSDVNSNKIFKIDPQTGAEEVYLSPSGGANGLAFDAQQNLIMCRRDARGVARLESDSTITVLASHYDGKRFNSPNDLVIRSDGAIFFTDPYFSGRSPEPRELDFEGIFCIKPDGELLLLETSLTRPNGITLSPDEKKLYVNRATKRVIYVFDIENDFTLINKSVFAFRSVSGNVVDGMKVDKDGLLFSAAGNNGIWIFSPDGAFVDEISVPGNVTNLNWGDADYQTLYITAVNNVYKIRLNTKGVVTGVDSKEASIPDYFELSPNYPNPFNPSTTIAFTLSKSSSVTIKVFDISGREVATLVDNEVLAPGKHKRIFDARDLAAGVYLYRLQVGAFEQTQKLTLLK